MIISTSNLGSSILVKHAFKTKYDKDKDKNHVILVFWFINKTCCEEIYQNMGFQHSILKNYYQNINKVFMIH